MDDTALGTRNKRGDWAPHARLELAPFWHLPPSPLKILKWGLGYVWPWNLFFIAMAAIWWTLFVPDAEALRALAWGPMLGLFAANWVGLLLFYGAFELRYYVRRVQDRRFKYNGKFPAEQASDVFWFRSQNLDNFVRSFFIGVPIGTAIELALLWAFATGHAPSLNWEAHPGQIIAWVLLAPLIHELHFFVIHRAIHTDHLYKWVHAIHHNSVNPSPWSSMSMHPVEATAYFGVALWVLALPSHPFIAVYFFTLAAFGAIVGHIGFDQLELGADRAAASHAYAHYLHHKHFEVNYCDNGVLPLDHWFGSWHDGSPEGERRMQERFKKKRDRLNATA